MSLLSCLFLSFSLWSCSCSFSFLSFLPLVFFIYFFVSLFISYVFLIDLVLIFIQQRQRDRETETQRQRRERDRDKGKDREKEDPERKSHRDREGQGTKNGMDYQDYVSYVIFGFLLLCLYYPLYPHYITTDEGTIFLMLIFILNSMIFYYEYAYCCQRRGSWECLYCCCANGDLLCWFLIKTTPPFWGYLLPSVPSSFSFLLSCLVWAFFSSLISFCIFASSLYRHLRALYQHLRALSAPSWCLCCSFLLILWLFFCSVVCC